MEKYARKCDCCGSGMNKGYLDNSATYCSDRCLVWGNSVDETLDMNKFEGYNPTEWSSDCENFPDECYYTEWEEVDEEEYFDKVGIPYGKCVKCKQETKIVDFCTNCGACVT